MKVKVSSLSRIVPFPSMTRMLTKEVLSISPNTFLTCCPSRTSLSTVKYGQDTICGSKVYFFQPWIFFFISGRCIFQHLFFFLVITDLICKHLVIKKTAAADCFLYLNYLLFIWIDPYFYCRVYFSHPDFLYTDGLILFLRTYCSCFIIIYLFYKNKCFYELFEQICSKVNSSLHL